MSRFALILCSLVISCGPPKSGKPIVAPTLAQDAVAIPTRATLHLALNPEQTHYSGTVSYDLEVKVAGRRIAVDNLGPVIASAEWVTTDGAATALSVTSKSGSIQVEKDGGFAGIGQLRFEFQGTFRDEDGLFVQESGSRYVFSDFQPEDARRAFPCFDTPRFKYPWEISVTSPEGLVVVSNMPTYDIEKKGSKWTHIFEPTPPIPVYLVAVSSGQFFTEETAYKGTPIRFLFPDNSEVGVSDALKVTPDLLGTLEDYFGMSQPFPKLDFVAVPRFAGAMENPGLITISQSILLDHGGRRNEDLRRLVIAHELAHLWIGDYVTISDWRDLWVQEGFATWLANKALHAAYPSRGYDWNELQDRYDAMLYESSEVALPIRPSQVPNAKDDLFSPVTYKKAGVVIAMLEREVGPEAFQEKLVDLVTGRPFGQLAASDIKRTFSAGTSGALTPVWDDYVSQTGLPLVTATPACTDAGASIVYTQEAVTPRPSTATWTVPLCSKYGKGQEFAEKCFVLRESKQVVGVDFCPSWVVPNENGAAVVLQRIEPAQLTAALGDNAIGTRTRIDLLRSNTALSQAGYLETPEALTSLKLLLDGATNQVLFSAISELDWFRKVTGAAGMSREYGQFVRAIAAKRGRELGWLATKGDEKRVERRLRQELLWRVALWSGDSKLIADAREAYEEWFSQEELPYVEGIQGLLYTVIPTLGKNDRSKLQKRFMQEKQPLIRLAILHGMTAKPRYSTVKRMMYSKNLHAFETTLFLSELGESERGRKVLERLGKKSRMEDAVNEARAKWQPLVCEEHGRGGILDQTCANVVERDRAGLAMWFDKELRKK